MQNTARSLRSRPTPRRTSSQIRSAIETVEPRLMLHSSAPVIPIADLTRPTGAAPDVIDLTQSFNTTTNPTRVAFGFDVGRVVVELFDTVTPKTVANFLNYARTDRYDGTAVHRSARLGPPTFSPFVVQGGGYRETDLTHITTDLPVQNEFHANAQQRGTISMAKSGGNPNSATSEWFFNLRDNKDILDAQNGGFTSFGQVVGNGMNVVDAIAALPVTTVNNLDDFPVENLPATAPQDYVNTNFIAELPELTGVTSDNTALVNPVLTGTTLTLNYGAGQTGVAHITINATDRLGAAVTESFAVVVGGTSVAVGEGSPAQSITYTDADGTAGVITVKGGSATVSFTGTNLTQTPSGRNVAVGGGADAEVFAINVTGGSPSITVQGTGGDGHLVVNGLNGGAVRSFSGREVILRGTSNVQQGLGKLDLFQTQNANITIGTSVDGRLQPTITLGSGQDTDINSAAPIKSIRFGGWTSTDADPDVIGAPSINTLQSGGDFPGGLNITGASTTRNLGNVRISGAAGGVWTVTGAAGNVTAESTASTWNATISGFLNNLSVAGDLSGQLTAAAVKSIRAATVTNATIRLMQPRAASTAPALGNLTARGAITDSEIRAVEGDVRGVTAGSLTGASILAGVATGPGQLPGDAAGFTAPATIRSVNVRNRTAASFVNSVVTASTLGKLNLGVVNTSNGGTPLGVAGQTIQSVTAVDQAGAPIRHKNLTDPAQLPSGDFVVLVY